MAKKNKSLIDDYIESGAKKSKRPQYPFKDIKGVREDITDWNQLSIEEKVEVASRCSQMLFTKDHKSAALLFLAITSPKTQKWIKSRAISRRARVVLRRPCKIKKSDTPLEIFGKYQRQRLTNILTAGLALSVAAAIGGPEAIIAPNAIYPKDLD